MLVFDTCCCIILHIKRTSLTIRYAYFFLEWSTRALNAHNGEERMPSSINIYVWEMQSDHWVLEDSWVGAPLRSSPKLIKQLLIHAYNQSQTLDLVYLITQIVQAITIFPSQWWARRTSSNYPAGSSCRVVRDRNPTVEWSCPICMASSSGWSSR